MALRMEVNQELELLTAELARAVKLLKSGGRLAVISFHSGEDRIVKNFIRNESRDCLCPPRIPRCMCDHQATLKAITKKPLRANDAEMRLNTRARSALLRVAEKL
jgi:16S rRNA (cytosine1402-N4)-methyltransferase